MKNTIELRKVLVPQNYAKKWNEHMNDFLNLYKNNEKVSDTLYRTGAFGGKVNEPYFLMLKYTESFYEDNITKDEKKKPHLKGQWCIIDNEGVEKVIFEQFASPYLAGGVIYSLDRRYYNIETGELYCCARESMDTEEFLFLHNPYDNDKSRRGVMKINKLDGTYELFKQDKQ